MKLHRRHIAVVVVLGSLAAGIWLARPRERSLLRGSKLVAREITDPDTMHAWRHMRPWYSPREIMVLRNADELVEVPRTDGIPGRVFRGIRKPEAYRINVLSGATAQMKPLNARLRSWRLQHPDDMIEAVSLSPDRSSLLLERNRFWPSPGYLVAATDGSALQYWARENEVFHSAVLWLQDCRSLLRIRYADNQGTPVARLEARRIGHGRPVRAMAIGPITQGGHALGLTGRGAALIGYWNEYYPANRATLLEVDPDRLRIVRSAETLRATTGAGIQWLALSPAGDRLAWLTRTASFVGQPEPTWFSAVKRWLGATRRPIAFALLVSRLDGSGMRELGPIDGPAVQSSADPPDTCAWSPDGRTIAYTYHHALWTVPVD